MIKLLRIKIYYYIKYLKYLISRLHEWIYTTKLKIRVKNKDFTIISSNCWGGSIYEDLNQPYLTPTVGLFFFAPCYIKFVSDLQTNLQKELTFIEHSKYEKGNLLQEENPYPIGIINNEIEIHFLHYAGINEAKEKWDRRRNRVCNQNIFLSFTDNETCTLDEIQQFDALPYPKVFFSAKKIKSIKSLVWLKRYKDQEGIGNIYDNRWQYRKYINVAKWLNTKST